MYEIDNTKKINDYYSMVRGSLKIIAEIISENEGKDFIDNSAFFGRSGSSYFEEVFLKPLIQRYNHLFANEINKRMNDNMFRFVRIEAPDATDESKARAVADVSVFIQHPDETISEEYVNVKATSGKTADNVGSWESLNHVLYGNGSAIIKQRNQLLNKISIEPVNDSLSDYFLWVFNKNGATVQEIMRTCETHSMLGSSLTAFKINMSQNYPIQFNSHIAEEIVFEEGDTIQQVKRELLYKILEAGIKFHKNQLEMWSAAYGAIQQD